MKVPWPLQLSRAIKKLPDCSDWEKNELLMWLTMEAPQEHTGRSAKEVAASMLKAFRETE